MGSRPIGSLVSRSGWVFAPHRQGKFYPGSLMAGQVGGPVHPFMFRVAPGGMDVLLKLTFQIDEGATPGTVAVLIEGGEVDGVVHPWTWTWGPCRVGSHNQIPSAPGSIPRPCHQSAV